MSDPVAFPMAGGEEQEGQNSETAPTCARRRGRLPDGVSARIWKRQQVRQYLERPRTNTVAVHHREVLDLPLWIAVRQ
jgi:hypothetical protein